jgi:plastocyanin
MENTNTPLSENKKSFSLPIVVGSIIVVGIIFAVILMGGKETVQSNGRNLSGHVEAANTSGPIKEFTVDGTNFAFDPKTITVNKGDTVKIIFKDTDGAHNLAINGYNVSTRVIGEGSQETVQFVADKVGSFEYYCSVGGHREAGMVGTLIVE